MEKECRYLLWEQPSLRSDSLLPRSVMDTQGHVPLGLPLLRLMILLKLVALADAFRLQILQLWLSMLRQ